MAIFLLTSCDQRAPQPVEVSPGDGSRSSADSDTRAPMFFPSAQATQNSETASLDHYASNADCLRCHERIGEEWKGSMHAAAFHDPIFRALYRKGSQETDGLTDRLCMGCHSSPLVVSGHGAPEGLDQFGPPVDEGVSCVVCHSISGSNLASPDALPANASFVTDPQGPIRGPYAERRCLQRGRATVPNEVMTRSEFCANCHGIVHPVNGFVIERTYEEWRDSIYAKKGIQCQDCHMQPVERAIQTARTLQRVRNPGRATPRSPLREHISSHRFVGANAAVTRLLGADEHAAMAEKLLKSAASLELILRTPFTPGKMADFDVRVTNETAGHNLPTSLVEVRQMWLDVVALDADGNEVFRSGAVDKQGNIDSDAVMFHAVAADADGNPTIKPWEMTQFLSTHTIPPRGSLLEHYTFAVPADLTWPVKIHATLRYRSYSQELARLLLGHDTPVVPIVDMTSIEKTLEVP
ncbi:MAG: cytochrome C [Fuerstiella sp.]|nr:cytochrome C [Fuerstiella sp.]MCP4857160.1 cytochrome C [Fuerstiella sp.]